MEKAKHTKKPHKNFAFGISFSEFMLSLAAGVGGAFVTASNKVTELFDSDQRHATAFKDHFEGFDETKGVKWGDEVDRRVNAKPPEHVPDTIPVGRIQRLDGINIRAYKTEEAYWEAIAKEKAEIYKDYLEVVKRERGVTTRPIFGTIERFRNLSPGSRKALLMPGTIGAVLGTAMTLSFFNGMVTREKINAIDAAVEPEKDQPKDQKTLAFKDREAPPTPEEKQAAVEKKHAAEQKKHDELKHADDIIEGKTATPAKEERPLTQVSHIDKLAAVANDNDITRDVANR